MQVRLPRFLEKAYHFIFRHTLERSNLHALENDGEVMHATGPSRAMGEEIGERGLMCRGGDVGETAFTGFGQFRVHGHEEISLQGGANLSIWGLCYGATPR